jgi:hypothetical protein
MMRHFALLGVVGVCLVPDGAPALGGYGPWYGPPGCVVGPVPECVPHFVLIPPCLPPLNAVPAPVAPAYPTPEVTPATPPAQPRVVPDTPAQPKAAGPSGGLPRLPTTGVPERPAPPPVIPPGGTPMTPSSFTPAQSPTPSELLAKPRPVGPTVTPPVSPVILPVAATDPAVPPADAVKLPPLVPRVPGGGSKGGPPALRIELPGEPRTAQSSPLTDRRPTDVAVVPVAAAVGETPGASRTVNVFNHADRAVKLTIAGQDVTLPARTFVKATVQASFIWSLDGGDPRTTDIPPASPGVEIVIRR